MWAAFDLAQSSVSPQVVAGRFSRIRNSENQDTAAVDREIPIGSGWNRTCSGIAVQSQIAECRKVADLIVGVIETDVPCSGWCRGRRNWCQCNGIGSVDQISQRGIAIERDLIIGWNGTSAAFNHAAKIRVAIAAHGWRSWHIELFGDRRATVQGHIFWCQLLDAAFQSAID